VASASADQLDGLASRSLLLDDGLNRRGRHSHHVGLGGLGVHLLEGRRHAGREGDVRRVERLDLHGLRLGYAELVLGHGLRGEGERYGRHVRLGDGLWRRRGSSRRRRLGRRHDDGLGLSCGGRLHKGHLRVGGGR